MPICFIVIGPICIFLINNFLNLIVVFFSHVFRMQIEEKLIDIPRTESFVEKCILSSSKFAILSNFMYIETEVRVYEYLRANRKFMS